MVKRLTIVLFCIGLMGLWSTDAKAWPASSSGWYVKSGSIIVGSDWVHISNTDVKPTDIVVTIYPTILVYYKNPAGNEGGVGTPFTLNVPLVGFDGLDPLAGRGKANSEVEFPTITVSYLDNNGINLSDYAPNPNWAPVDNIIVTGLDWAIDAYADVNGTCEDFPPSHSYYDTGSHCYLNDTDLSDLLYEERVVHLEGLCTATFIGWDVLNEKEPVYTFECVEVESEHWEYSKKVPFWP